MRTIWMLISTLAIANLLALAGFVGWLQASGRLSPERLQRLREVLAPTVAAEDAAEQMKLIEAQAAAAKAQEDSKAGRAPLTAEQRLLLTHTQIDVTTQQQQRVQRETADLIATLLQERTELERQRAEFQAQVEEFNTRRNKIIEQEGSEQFRKAVALYGSLKPAQARTMLDALIKGGQTDQVVAYLNALQARTASKIISEFERDQPQLAADLLERLRQRGTEFAGARPPEG